MVFNVYVSGSCTCTPTGSSNTQLAVMRHNLLIHVQVVIRFTQLADESEDVPALCGKKYRDFRLSKLEWEQLKVLYEVMQVSLCICMPYRVPVLTINDRSQQQHSNPSQNLMSLLCGAQSLSWNSCNRHGRTWQISRSSMSSLTRFMVDWRTYASGIIKLMTLMYTSFALVSTIDKVMNNESNMNF